ncbi:MAG: hypothetical protein JWO95_3264 [Verrucomicrobiales bacterium]|nr:hypothetical protein [Verrucomicrobiales bacterium]
MKVRILFSLLLALAISASAQVTARRALQPLTKQGVIPPGPPPNLAKPAPPAPAHPPVAPPPAAAVPAIEPNLKPSPITLFGKIDGLSGTFFVTNVGTRAVAPFTQLAVLDRSGKPVGWVTNSAAEIQPKEAAKIQVLATNANAVDFKIVRLMGHK